MSRIFFIIRVWLALIVVAASVTVTPAFAQGSTVVRVDPAALTAQVNDIVNLSIKVDNIANLTAIELHLSFNPSVLEVTQVANGGFVAADFTAQNVFDNAAGTIDYAVAQMNRPAAQGSGALLNITFRAKGNGTSTLALRATPAVPSGLLLSDANGMAIQASWVNGNVNVGTPAPTTPAPTTPAPTTPAPTTPAPTTPAPTTPAPTTPVPTTPVPTTPVPTTAVPTFTPTPITPPPGNILGIHVVKLGEWLFCIGRAYGVSPWAIAETNGVWWPYFIFPNQRLSIPNVPWINMPAGQVCKPQFTISKPTPTPTAIPTNIPTIVPTIATTAIPVTPIPTLVTTAVPSSTCRAFYVVRPGDTLYHIASMYGTTYPEIARVNNIPNPRLIFSGQQLCIP